MNHVRTAGLVLLFAASTAFAATSTDKYGVTTSTDPDKAAAVERHAQELQSHQTKMSTSGTQSTQPLSKHHKRMKHHKKHVTKTTTTTTTQ